MTEFFTKDEFAARLHKTRSRMRDEKLDALLIFAPESMYWLTGFDTFGFCFFQCLVVTQNDKILLTRSADLRQAQHTSDIKDIRIWQDKADENPALDLKAILNELDLAGKNLGIEYDTHGLTAANYRKVDQALANYAKLVDQSYLISELRLIKSPQELAHTKRAAELADHSLDAGIAAIKSNATDAAVLAAMQGDIFARGGGYPANEFILGSGRDALLCRYKSSRRSLTADDQMTIEWAGVYARYHAAMMRTLIIGKPTSRHEEMFAAAKTALVKVSEQMTPGKNFGDVYQAHADALDDAGLSKHRLNACGYSLGARFTPSWMEHQMFYEQNPQPILPNMVLFAHMIIMDSDTETAMCLGQTFITTQKEAVNLSRHALEMITI